MAQTPEQRAASNKRRADAVRQRWAEAKVYAARHGTRPRLDKRSVKVTLTNLTVSKSLRTMLTGRPDYKLPKGTAADVRLFIRQPGGEVVNSGPLTLGAVRTDRDLQKYVRDAWSGVFRASSDYDQIEDVDVTADGELVVDGDEWEIFIEPDSEDEPLVNEEIGNLDDIEDDDEGDE